MEMGMEIALVMGDDRELELDQTFENLYSREAPDVLRFLRTASDPEHAEDLCADVFSAAWRSWPRFRGTNAQARAWVYRIARNAVVDAHRRQKRLRFVGLQPTFAATSTDGPGGDTLDLRRALGRLGIRDRSLLALRAAGLSYEEIGNIHKLRPGAARVAWHRSARRLRDLLEAE
ncbi:MAG: RNA polymerase sigma factor [Candidatus Dormibacteria bacterium]